MSSFKSFKRKNFQVNGETHTHLMIGYKGRVLSFNTLNWSDEPDSFTIDDEDNLVINAEIEIHKEETPNGSFLNIMPKFDLDIV